MILKVLEEKFYINYSAGYSIGYPAKKLAGYLANSVSGATLCCMQEESHLPLRCDEVEKDEEVKDRIRNGDN